MLPLTIETGASKLPVMNSLRKHLGLKLFELEFIKVQIIKLQAKTKFYFFTSYRPPIFTQGKILMSVLSLSRNFLRFSYLVFNHDNDGKMIHDSHSDKNKYICYGSVSKEFYFSTETTLNEVEC